MDPKDTITSQYLASLEMLRSAINHCPPSLWTGDEFTNTFWHISYHVLFYTHLYLQDSEEQFIPWKKHRKHHQHLGSLPEAPHTKPEIGDPYSKEEILEYLDICKEEVENKIPSLDLKAKSGFSWLPINKMELQLYNIRHIQHHTGALTERLRTKENVGIDWVAMI